MKIITKNKSAYLDYEIIDTYTAGVVLHGYEVKSIKGSHVNIKDAIVKRDEPTRHLKIRNMDIPLYERTSPLIVPGYQPKAPRDLLVTSKELAKIVAKTTKTGNSIIPLEIQVNTRGKIVILIAVAARRKKVEKKQYIKEKEMQREMDRTIKAMRRS